MTTLPEGYALRSAGPVTAFAYGPTAAWLESVLGSGVDLYTWAASRDQAKPLVGRGPVHAVVAPTPGPDGRGRWAVRRYHRGGLMAPLLGDRYARLGATRPVRELVATVEARARGIPAPAIVAGAVYSAGPFYRADLVTELIPHARTLEALVFSQRERSTAVSALLRAGRLVRSLEEARVLHADLNAMNVLLLRGDEGSAAHVVDLDRCRIMRPGSKEVGDGMRRRLERSLRKLGVQHGRPLGTGEWDALHAGYEEPA